MDTFLAIALVVLLPATFSAFAVAIFRERRLAKHLERTHPSIWAEIAPTAGAMPSVSSPFARFVQERRYLQLGDPCAQQLGDLARKTFYVAITLFFMLLAVGLTIGVREDLG